jgi:diguanylate cyclase (GGDEF)-like protein/PAS domain S-box-containing protein
MDINNEFWVREVQRVAKLGYYIFDIKNDIWTSSEILDELFGIDSNYVKDLQGWLNIIHPTHREDMSYYITELLQSDSEFDKAYKILRQNDKSVRWVLGKGKLYYDKYGAPEKLIGTIQDITKIKASEETLQKNEEKYKQLSVELEKKEALLKSLINSIPDLIFYKDKNSVYLGCNKAFESFAGIKEKDLIGLNDYNIFNKEAAELFTTMDLKMMQQGESRKNEEWVVYPDGKRVLLDTLKTPFYDAEENVLGLIGISRDITERKTKEDEILYLSYNDVLTGVYNRRFFEEEFKRIDTEKYYPLSIIMGDVNGLKIVNDAFGHLEGDNLLKSVAIDIKYVCAEMGVVARWGGDEFVVLLPNTTNETCGEICKDILSKKENNTTNIKTSISLGYSTKFNSEENITKILKEAEDMMYKHKLTESDSYRYFIIQSITKTLYEKDHETEEHANRLKNYCNQIGKLVGLSELELNELEVFAALHDIGKIAINENILKKTEKLTEEECCKLKKHSEIGYRIVKSVPELINIADFILAHHERWDGNGYPKGLKGTNIPLLSRILAVVDAYDAMTNDRSYRKALSKDESIKELLINAGKQFDPHIVEIFIKKVLKSN